MPYLMRFSRDLESRLDRASQQTGIAKADLIKRLVRSGLSDVETQLLLEEVALPLAYRTIDQRLRESGLGA
jgi:predicted DNA-binding protein